MSYVVVAVRAHDLDRDSLRDVLARHVEYDARRQQRARHVRWSAVVGSIALACCRSGLWTGPAAVLAALAALSCVIAHLVEWRARLRLDRVLAGIPAVTMAREQIDNPPTAP